MKKSKVSTLYMFFGILFTTCILISNIAAGKNIMVGPWTLTAGVIVFPISYIMSDVIAEVYGFHAARRVMWLGFAMNLLMVVMFAITIALPAPVWFENQAAFATVLGNTPRLLFAGLISYVFGSWANAAVISKMKVLKQKDGGKGFGWRAVISTIVGESIDSLLFIPLAFVGNVPLGELPMMIILQVLFKTSYEVVMLPVTSRLVKWVKKVEEIDVYDVGETYSLFK